MIILLVFFLQELTWESHQGVVFIFKNKWVLEPPF